MTSKAADFIISMEGVGSSGKTTQIGMLAESLRSGYRVTSHKIINRNLLENALKPLYSGERETIWVASLPDVTVGADMLAWLALYMQRYSAIKAEVDEKPHIFLIERYIYTAFTHAAARAVLREIAKVMGDSSHAPGRLAEQIQKESVAKKVHFERLVAQYKNTGMKNAGNEIDALYKTFAGARNIVTWPNLVFVLDLPVELIKPREVKRENRAYTPGDVIYYSIVAELYRRVAKREKGRVYLIDGAAPPAEVAKKISAIVKRRCKMRAYKK
ncbi:MAG: hypothetical protein M1160_00330 [Candidatus Marsarchaeota archaeon]|jgi:thymidylate kinase|nr:hypothetical protein [Candidatus Marsarchaeota archaeon]MCL5111318.1 hypothetical protein [Candidatus Marsarchaeota archaeon]